MNHAADFLEAADRHCQARGVRLTDTRRRVLELALAKSGVVKAYDVLAALQKERGQVAPPTVYRALDFLLAQGLLHRVDALNGFIVCQHLDCPHESLTLVCEACGRVTEFDGSDILAALRAAAAASGFQARRADVVLSGTCQECQA